MVHSTRRYKSRTACNIPLPLETRPVGQLVASLCCYSGGLGAPKLEKVSFSDFPHRRRVSSRRWRETDRVSR
jgi:hypothetical protein